MSDYQAKKDAAVAAMRASSDAQYSRWKADCDAATQETERAVREFQRRLDEFRNKR